jgi:hypothetical protein
MALTFSTRRQRGLQSHTLAQIEAGIARTGIIDPIENPFDPRLIAKFNEDLCLKHRVLPWRSASGRVIVLAVSCDHFLKVRDTLTSFSDQSILSL